MCKINRSSPNYPAASEDSATANSMNETDSTAYRGNESWSEGSGAAENFFSSESEMDGIQQGVMQENNTSVLMEALQSLESCLASILALMPMDATADQGDELGDLAGMASDSFLQDASGSEHHTASTGRHWWNHGSRHGWNSFRNNSRAFDSGQFPDPYAIEGQAVNLEQAQADTQRQF